MPGYCWLPFASLPVSATSLPFLRTDPTICNLAGVKDCTDNANLGGKIRPIDGTDQWAAITGSVAEVVPREWLPITPDSIIYEERWCETAPRLCPA